MKNKQMLEEGKEALQRTLLMMNYDMKKTLTENVEVVSEQENVGGNPEDLQIAIKLKNAVQGAGTDEQSIIDAISAIKDKTQFDRVNALVPKYMLYKNVQDALNNEFETDNLEQVKTLKDILGKIGVNLAYKTTVNPQNGDIQYKFKTITITPGVSNTTNNSSTQTPVNTKDAAAIKQFTSFSCVPNHPRAKQSKMSNGSFAFIIDGEVYYDNGRKKDKSGKMVSFTCNDTIFIGSSRKKSVPSITDKNVLSKLKFDYQFPGDKSYTYAFVPTVTEDTSTQSGTWYAKSTKTGKVFDISKSYPQTAQKLNTQFPNAATGNKTQSTSQTAQIPAETNTTSVPKTDDVSSIQSKKLEVQPVGPNLSKPNNIKLPNNTKSRETNVSNPESFDPFGPATESLKKSLKKNLIEVKENKENIMVETNIVEKRFNFIVEGKTFDNVKDQNDLVESVISEIGYLKTQGYTSKAINEGLFSMLGSLLGGGAQAVPAVFGEYIAGWLTEKLGIPKNSYMNGVIVSLVGNLNISDYDRFFSDCRFASNKIADSLIEGYLVQIQNQKDVNSGASGFIVSALRNSVVDYFAEDKNSLIQILEDKIGEFLCPKLSKLSNVISSKTSEMKGKMVA
jgi:hypothetical protein